jgi:hypothetical protein
VVCVAIWATLWKQKRNDTQETNQELAHAQSGTHATARPSSNSFTEASNAAPEPLASTATTDLLKPDLERAATEVKPQALTPPPQTRPRKKKERQDPLAREALTLVGVDPAAEQYWFEAIHDPSLSKSERQDLIDDLNENGLEDPKHPKPEELPLILSRIEALEALAPTLSDEFDWEESYSDLANLADVALGGGKPVQ